MADVNARLLQAIKPAASDLRIGILHSGNNTRHTGGDQRIAARRRATMMTTGFKRNVGRCPLRFFSRHTQSMDFGMRLARAMVIPLTDDFPIFNNHTAHVGIGVSSKTSARSKLQRSRHVQFILHGLVL